MKADRAERYFDSQAWVYDLSRRFFLRGRGEAIRTLDLREGNSVVEFGCGTGMNFKYLYDSGISAVCGVDASGGMLARAKRRYPRAELIHADFVEEKLGLKGDRVLCAYALSLVDRWEEALLNMKETLTAEGTLVVLDFHPLKSALQWLDPLIRWWIGVHGADATRPVASFLKAHFHDVRLQIPACGFYQIVKASGPLFDVENTG